MEESEAIEDAAWSSAYGIATSQQAALLEADPTAWRESLERLVTGIDKQLGEGQSDGDTISVDALTAVRTHLQGALDRLNDPTTTPIAAAVVDGEQTGDAGPAGEPQRP